MKLVKRNSINILFFMLLLTIIFVPDAKAFLLRSLMTIGFYTPDPVKTVSLASDLDGIKFKDIKGKLVDLGDLKGKVIFLNFWATWCPPCRAEMPSLHKLFTQFKNDKNVVFIFVDADGDLKKSAKFIADRQYELPVYAFASEIPKQVFESALPTTVIFDRQGRLSFRHEGMANYNDQKFVDFINKLKNTK
ncbi:TlpA family protein disulfide reductase [Pedobacter sp. MR22-3]|uniref:TlpA family protein disulfide reductase n=1 Tax=Pedobacter sp. MR22-3 TaxID=2994552 RepID=UPI0022467BAA|nr:TlpA disulfide reductase family protein [Pedobacter sp. MR22-3]MCX2582265.1 TlpA disulfide reductase family protein [Pedobacter sp. MR22-3]